MDLSPLRNIASDPLKVGKWLWPKVEFYDRQREIIYSVKENDETYVVAANMMGKDFVAGYIALCAFLFPETFLGNGVVPPGAEGKVRIVTTSVKDDHLRVLWGEIGQFIRTSAVPLPLREQQGIDLPPGEWRPPGIVPKFREIRKMAVDGQPDTISYLRGMVSEKGEGMAGHHAPYTLGIIDEASGVDQVVYTQMGTWARKLLIFGNANPCGRQHFFYQGVRGGDLLAKV